MPSQIMIDRATSIPRAKIDQLIGRLDDATLTQAARVLSRFLGLE